MLLTAYRQPLNSSRRSFRHAAMNTPPRRIQRRRCSLARVSRFASQGKSRARFARVGDVPKTMMYASREPAETLGPALCSIRE